MSQLHSNRVVVGAKPDVFVPTGMLWCPPEFIIY
jgi:hypothetical protein